MLEPRRPANDESEPSGCWGVIVGLHNKTATVATIWVREDGSMLFGGRKYRPLPGRAPTGETIMLFGLTKARHFQAAEVVAARAYAARLELELEPSPPRRLI